MPEPVDKAAILKKVHALLARASDDGASEEERRTSGVIAARLIREHGLTIGDVAASAPPMAPRGAEFARSVVQLVISGRHALDTAVGFDVWAYAQGLLRDRIQSELAGVLSAPRPKAAAPKRPRARKK